MSDEDEYHPGLGVERVEKVLALILDLLRLGGLPREPVLPRPCLNLLHVVLVLFGEFVHLGPLEARGGDECKGSWAQVLKNSNKNLSALFTNFSDIS
jgi:hypothetical protein